MIGDGATNDRGLAREEVLVGINGFSLKHIYECVTMNHSKQHIGKCFLMGIAVCLGARGGTGDSTTPPALGGICRANIWGTLEYRIERSQ